MRALLCHDYGGMDDLRLIAEAPLPEPEADQVRIAVHAAGMNFADTLIIQGKYQEKPLLPFSPGFEAAGIVDAVGDNVTHVKPGDRVLAQTRSGAFADYALAAADQVFSLPPSMDFETAAAFPIAYGSAYGALCLQGRLQAGETLVVHGAAGGVGLAAVEVGKAMGATVIATAGGPEKLALAKEHGADHLIDYRREDVRKTVKHLTEGRGADVVFDPVGGDVFDASLRCIAWNGRLVIVGFAGGRVQQIPANHLLVKNVACLGFYWGSYCKHAPEAVAKAFEQLFAWHAKGKLRPHISHVLPLEAATEGMELLLARKATGKIVLTVRKNADA